MICVAIIEDQEQDAGILRRCLEKYGAEIGEQFKISCFSSGLKFLENYQARFDLVFMDVEMPDLDGMTTARRLRDMDQQVRLIFVTNMAKYAVQGYSVGAMDYILKPVRYSDIKMRMERIRGALRMREQKIVLPGQSGVKILSVQDIVYIESVSHQITFHTVSGDHVTRKSMTEWEQELEDKGFARCNTSYIVNLRHVQEVCGNDVIVAGKTLPISRVRKQEFIKKLMRMGL